MSLGESATNCVVFVLWTSVYEFKIALRGECITTYILTASYTAVIVRVHNNCLSLSCNES